MSPKLEWTPTEIDELPELIRLAEDVRDSGEPRLLQCDDEAVAVLVPVEMAKSFGLRGPRTEADREAFLRSAGGWKGLIDTDKFIEDIYESRGRSVHPPVER